MQDFNKMIIEEFRANAGVVGGPFEGATLVLLTTTGAKSGKRTTSPTMYFQDGDRYFIIASNGGADHHPRVVPQPARHTSGHRRDRHGDVRGEGDCHRGRGA